MPKYEKISTLMTSLKEMLEHQSDPKTIKVLALGQVKTSKVNNVSELSMIQVLEKTKDPLATVYNLILKYEGNGVIR